MTTTSPFSQKRLLSGISMAVFATAGAIALTASTSSPAFAVANEDNSNNGTGGVMGSADTIKWTAPAAGTDENWTVADGVNIGTGGAVVIASDTDGVGALTFAGDSTATGTIGDTTHRIGLITTSGASGKTVTITGVGFADDINIDGTGTLALQSSFTLDNDINFGADGVLSLSDGVNVTSGGAAAISNTTTNNGTLNIAGDTTITGTTGSTGAGLKAINVNGSGKTATFSDDVKATTITVASGATAVFNNGANITATTLANSTTNTGTVTIKGGTVAAAIGNTGVGFNLINVAESADVALTGDIKATTTKFTGNNVLTLEDTSDITGAVTTSSDGAGKLTVNGTSTLSSTVGASGTELHTVTFAGGSGKTLTLSDDVYTDNYTAATAHSASVVSLADGAVLNVTNGMSSAQTGAGIYNFVVTRTGTNGALAASAGAFDLGSSTVRLDFASGNMPWNNSAYTIADGTSAATISGVTTADTGLGSFALTRANSNTDVVATYTRANANLWATRSTGENVALATVLDSIGVDSDFTTLFTALDSDTPTNPTASVDSILSTVRADVAANPQEAQLGQAGVVGERLKAVSRSKTGVASGDANGGRGIWVQAFGATERQDSQGTRNGYDADTMGVAAGFDKRVRPNVTLGVTAGYAQTDSDRLGSTGSVEIDSYQAGLYGSYERDQLVLSGLLSGAYNQYDSARYVTALGVNAKGDYDGYSYLARAKADYVVPVKGGFDITPNASLTYVGSQADTYTETGAAGLNMTVDRDNTNALLGRVGLDFGHTYKSATKYVRPELRVGYMYDMIGDAQSATSTFTGGGASFVTRGVDPKQGSLVAGAGLELVSVGGFYADANYDYTHRSDYNAHAGMLRVGLRY